MSVEVSVKYDFTEDQPTHNSTVDNQTQSSGALVKPLSVSGIIISPMQSLKLKGNELRIN